MNTAISIKSLSKKYRLSQPVRYTALRDVIAHSFISFFKRKKDGDFWALKNIDLEIKEGERIGIIGHNGAGKTTLLKIISRITPPTKGRVELMGRLASLLEVGTGFHPELTGKENIYLNGSILGLKKKEIDAKLEEIIAFSGVEMFIDSPLKNYSSGMQLRLAFSVAAHLEPDILLIDEVLAVGDMEFQKKCIGKMEEISNQKGRTILFVSHNMNYISSLCTSGLLLSRGQIVLQGPVQKVVSSYISSITEKNAQVFYDKKQQPGNDIVKLISVCIVNENEKPTESFSVAEKIGIEMKYEVFKNGYVLWLGHNIYNQAGINVFDTHSINTQHYRTPHKQGIFKSIVWIPSGLLNTGTYFIGSAVFNHLQGVIHFHEKDIVAFRVHDVLTEDSARGLSGGDFPGVIRPSLDWSIVKES